jgi:hypothetical protein
VIGRTQFDTACRIRVEHTEDFLNAHVELDGDVAIQPGDKVRVHGAPIRVPFGRSETFERTATVTRAGAIGRLWTKLIGHFEMAELYEVSFSGGALR